MLGSDIEYPLQSNALSAKSVLGGRVALTLLMLRVWEVQNFEWWEHSVVAEEAPAQDWVDEEPQQDCFRMSVAQ